MATRCRCPPDRRSAADPRARCPGGRGRGSADLLRPARPAGPAANGHRFGDRRPDGHARIERGERVLEDHLHATRRPPRGPCAGPARACRRGGRRRRRSAPGRPERVRPSTCPSRTRRRARRSSPRARAGRGSTAVRRRCPGRTARSARERRASSSRHRVLRGHERMPARHAMPGRERIERGHLLAAELRHPGTPGGEGTARRLVEGLGARPGIVASSRARSDSIVGTEATSAAVYGCAGAVASVATSSSSTMRPGVHDDDAAAHLRDDGVVRDEDRRGPARLAHVAERPQDLLLHGDVESGGRLVGDPASARSSAPWQ